MHADSPGFRTRYSELIQLVNHEQSCGHFCRTDLEDGDGVYSVFLPSWFSGQFGHYLNPAVALQVSFI